MKAYSWEDRVSQSSPSTNDRPAPDQTEKLFDMKGKNALGRHGEDETCQYLIDHGHTILERNWRYGHLEIDIISLAGDGIHFVEVKSRTAPVQGEPQEAVTASKQRHIASAAGKYMSMKQKYLGRDLEVWFDVAAITYDGAQVEFRYFPAAYVPIYL